MITFYLELLIVLSAIFIGARIGGIGLGVMGGVGLCVLTFLFNLEPASAPIDVMLIIVAVISASASLQASGGLTYMVAIAEKILRKHPKRIVIVAPFVSYLFTFIAGTGHIAYSILPIISEVSVKTGIRPERPLAISVIASQQAITASPITAATVAMMSIIGKQYFHLQLWHILAICIPATLIGVTVAALVSTRLGKELKDDPDYNEKLKDPAFVAEMKKTIEPVDLTSIPQSAKYSVWIFLAAVALIVCFGAIEALRPVWMHNEKAIALSMTSIIEMIMLSAAALILIVGKVKKISDVSSGNVFRAGMEAVIAIFGIAWMGNTFIQGNLDFMKGGIQEMVTSHVWTFAIALFVMSILLFSQAATVNALMPLGVSLGIPAASLIAMFPAVNGYFFIPNYPTLIAAIGFDKTGTTRIGKYMFNHSFMIPGLVATVVAIASGFVIASLIGVI